LALTEDAVLVHNLPQKSELSQAVSAQVSLSPDDLDLLEQFDVGEEDQDDNEREQILELLFENAAKAAKKKKKSSTSSDQIVGLAAFQQTIELL
jgi:negative regulator of genetic competence, sporulation and motility